MKKAQLEESKGRQETYRIRVRGHLDPSWSDWFSGLTITHEASGDTHVSGPVADQAALYGLLKKVHDLGLYLLSVKRIDPDKEGSGRHETE